MTTTLERPTVTPPPPARSPGARALTWTGAIVGGVLLLAGGYSAVDLLVLGSDDASTFSDTASYAAAPVVELVADGHVSVTTGGARVEVERTARTALTTAHYRVDQAADRLQVAYRCDQWRPGFCSASLDVTVPDGTSVVVRASDGTVTATTLSGPLDVHVSDGPSTISDIDGDVTVRSADGDTDISDVRGDVTVSSADGAATVSGVSGSVDVRSSDGRVEIADVQGNIDAHASDGDVTVYGTGEPVALDLSASDGRQIVEGPVDPTASVHVRIRTSDGDAAYLRPRG
ncbi:DUF4097 family beta strand repeat-containing protein [Cellulomonas sp. ICMP 17802]|uniref:DUF4097 family beta strand repeat-containing protein n=1 Tax=Cellulomonas sp. ICMP 17802 TaxID=3239199 RepID=UPI00351AB864